jgi:hypothetical protein
VWSCEHDDEPWVPAEAESLTSGISVSYSMGYIITVKNLE